MKQRLPIPVVPLTVFSALEVEHNEFDSKEKEKRRARMEEQKKKSKEKKKKAEEAQKIAAPSCDFASSLGGGKDLASPISPPDGCLQAAEVLAAKGPIAQLLQFLFNALEILLKMLGLGPPKKKKRLVKPSSSDLVPGSSDKNGPSEPRHAGAAGSPQDLHAVKGSSGPNNASRAASEQSPPTAVGSAAAASLANAKPQQSAQGGGGLKAPKAPEVAPEALPHSAAPKAPAVPKEGGDKTSLPKAASSDGLDRGLFLISETEGAHSDVVASVALSGETALSAGYDGAIKVRPWG